MAYAVVVAVSTDVVVGMVDVDVCVFVDIVVGFVNEVAVGAVDGAAGVVDGAAGVADGAAGVVDGAVVKWNAIDDVVGVSEDKTNSVIVA